MKLFHFEQVIDISVDFDKFMNESAITLQNFNENIVDRESLKVILFGFSPKPPLQLHIHDHLHY